MVMWDWHFDEKTNMIRWEPKSSNINKDEDINEKHFKFHLTRLKDPDTKREVLRIKAWENEEEITKIETSLGNLYDALLSLRDYGIVFSDDNGRMKLKRKIEQSYTSITKETMNVFENKEKSKFDNFMDTMVEYVDALKEPYNEKGFCNIRVAEFDQIALDCNYKEYEIQGLRKQLKENKCIYTKGDRYAILVRLNEKPTRVISFYKDAIEKYRNRVSN